MCVCVGGWVGTGGGDLRPPSPVICSYQGLVPSVLV